VKEAITTQSKEQTNEKLSGLTVCMNFLYSKEDNNGVTYMFVE
jgi:hypothetical protein